MVKLPANNVFDLEQKRLNQLIAENNNWIYSLSFGAQNLCAVPVPLKKRKTQRRFDHKKWGVRGGGQGVIIDIHPIIYITSCGWWRGCQYLRIDPRQQS